MKHNEDLDAKNLDDKCVTSGNERNGWLARLDKWADREGLSDDDKCIASGVVMLAVGGACLYAFASLMEWSNWSVRREQTVPNPVFMATEQKGCWTHYKVFEGNGKDRSYDLVLRGEMDDCDMLKPHIVFHPRPIKQHRDIAVLKYNVWDNVIGADVYTDLKTRETTTTVTEKQVLPTYNPVGNGGAMSGGYR